MEPQRRPKRKVSSRVVAALGLGVVCMVAALGLYAVVLEPRWVAQREIVLRSPPRVRLVHLTDIHYQGDRAYLERIVELTNAATADMVCFTGDLLEQFKYLDEALHALSGVNKPMYGVPGNHDCWDESAEAKVSACFRATGGRWLRDECVVALDGRVEIVGSTGRMQALPVAARAADAVCILLVHYPLAVKKLADEPFDLILAGHTHGGQVRFPGLGPLADFPGIGEYDRGLFDTAAGPLYVNPGVGTYHFRIRFCCRPEIAVVEL